MDLEQTEQFSRSKYADTWLRSRGWRTSGYLKADVCIIRVMAGLSGPRGNADEVERELMDLRFIIGFDLLTRVGTDDGYDSRVYFDLYFQPKSKPIAFTVVNEPARRGGLDALEL